MSGVTVPLKIILFVYTKIVFVISWICIYMFVQVNIAELKLYAPVGVYRVFPLHYCFCFLSTEAIQWLNGKGAWKVSFILSVSMTFSVWTSWSLFPSLPFFKIIYLHVYYPHLYKTFTDNQVFVCSWYLSFSILIYKKLVRFCHQHWATTINGILNSLIFYPIDKFWKMKWMSVTGNKTLSPEAVEHYHNIYNFKGCLILLTN